MKRHFITHFPCKELHGPKWIFVILYRHSEILIYLLISLWTCLACGLRILLTLGLDFHFTFPLIVSTFNYDMHNDSPSIEETGSYKKLVWLQEIKNIAAGLRRITMFCFGYLEHIISYKKYLPFQVTCRRNIAETY